MRKSDNTQKIVVALVLGAAVGVALGILFAPTKGSELREKLVGSGHELARALKLKLSALAQEGQRGEVMDAIEGNGTGKIKTI